MKILYLLIATLKFLGIAILILLLLLLLLVIIVLTVPIKYRVNVNKSEQTDVNVSVRWLYSIVGMDIIYNSESEMVNRFKLFGWVIGPRKPKKRNKPQKPKRPKEKVMEKPDDNNHIEQARQIKKTKKKKSGFKETLDKIQSFAYKKELFGDTLSLVLRFLKRLSPSTLYTEIEIGKENPADTGQLIAVVSAFYPIYHSFATIVGNYEKECFYVKLEASGKVSCGKLIYEFMKYIRVTSVKELIKFMRKDRKGKDHGRKITK